MKRIFLDLDGVLANWEGAVSKLLNRPAALGVGDYTWEELYEKNPRLYSDLELMPDAMQLWNYVTSSSVVSDVRILTAIPRRMHWPNCTDQKRAWVWEHLGRDVEVLFGPFAWDKQFHCNGIDDVLIDDTLINISQWWNRGGSGILHASTKTTIENLKRMGV